MTRIITKFAAIAALSLSATTLAYQNDAHPDNDVGPMDPSVPVAEEYVSPMDQSVPVAEEAAANDPKLDEDTDEVTEEKLLNEFARYRRLLSEGTLDEADIAAKRIVEMTIKVYGPRSRETANALNNLGIVQHSNGQFDAAMQNFSSAVEIIELLENKLDIDLVNPLKGLGAAQLAGGRPDKANDTFTRATHITHVNEGPHNIGQVEILESLVEIQLTLGDTRAARSILDRIHVLNVRFFEKDPLGLIPSLMERAKWQHRAGYYSDERVTYRRAIRIVESGNGKYDPMLIEPLRRLGESFYFVDLSVSTTQQPEQITTGEIYFKRAVRVAEKAENLDWRVLAATKLALADFYTYTDTQTRSRRIYREVWKLLSSDAERIAVRDELLGDPVATHIVQLPVFVGNSGSAATTPGERLTGRVTVDYTVSSRGRVRKLTTTVSPHEFTDIQRMVHREVRQRFYRPKIVEGKPVEAENEVFVHEFSYTQADLDSLRTQKAAGRSK